MKHFVFLLFCGFVLFSCGTGNDQVKQIFTDSLMVHHPLSADSIRIIDSIGYCKLIQQNRNRNIYLISPGKNHADTFMIARNFMKADLVKKDTAQLNASGKPEWMVRIYGRYFNPSPSDGSERETVQFFVLDPESGKILFNHCLENYERKWSPGMDGKKMETRGAARLEALAENGKLIIRDKIITEGFTAPCPTGTYSLQGDSLKKE